jgi:hypothetical protein
MRAFLLAALISTLGGGCYLAHEIDDDAVFPDGGRPDRSLGNDAVVLGRDSGRDAGMDAFIPIDAGSDTGFDAFVLPDSGIDVWAPDAPPPLEPPPDPSTCRVVPVIDPFTEPVLETRWPEHGGTLTNPSSIQVCATPVVIDLDPRVGDLDPVVVFTSYDAVGEESENGTLRIWNPRAETTVSWPADGTATGNLEASTNLAAGDLDGDGVNEIVGIGISAGTYAYRADGTPMWYTWAPSAVDRGLRRDRTIGGAISIADLEGDGTVEVIVGRNVIDGATGEWRWTGGSDTSRGANGILGPISCVADLDGDGVMEVVAGRSAIRANGTTMWVDDDARDGLCGIGELDPTSPGVEVALVSVGYLYVIAGPTGRTLWSIGLTSGGLGSAGGSPTIADFDGDGRSEVGVANGTSYAVYDHQCTAPHVPFDYCTQVGITWHHDTEDESSATTGSSVFDFNGDGRAEVVYNDQFTFRVFDGRSGIPLVQILNSSRTRTENPVIADVDADGQAEIIFSANNEANFLRLPHDRTTAAGVLIYGDRLGRWVGARRIWNEHPYHITNVDENGHIPQHEQNSWEVLNGYRQNLRQGGDVLVRPDLWGGRGRYACTGTNRATFSIDVANYGLERVGSGIVVGFYRGRPGAGGERIGEAVTTSILLPEGGSETVTFDAMLELPVTDYYALLDDAQGPMPVSVAECREGNNEALIWRPFCP